jgi:hypothetical protein
MNIKKKFESIDQSQLSESQKEILGKIKTATKDFTITDEKALQKVDSALDNIIEKLKKTNPQAIKTEPKKQEPKAKKEVVKKEPKSETKKPKEPKKESGGKRTIFSIAKEIRKADESWEEAKKRAKKIMETEKEDTTKKMKSETDKLLAFIKRRKELEGLSGTSVKKDSKIEALPKGKRVSKKGWKNQYGESEGGKVYYENRDNRTDRLAPKFEDKIYLEGGGGTKGYVEITNPKTQLFDKGYRIYGGDSWETLEDLKKSYAGRSLPKGAMIVKLKGGKVDYFAIAEKERFASGGYVVIAKSEKGGGFVMSKPSTKAKAEKLKSLLPKIDGETNEVMTVAKASKLSGLAGKEYLKYADGGTIIGTPETPLARGLGMDYTGLVGETGAMSSGELFAGGGGLKKEGYYVFSNKRNVIIADGFKTENEAKNFMYDYYEQKHNDFSLSIKKYASGGYADKGVYVETLDEEIDLSEDGRIRARKTQEGKNLSYGELREKHGASPEALAFAEGGSLGNHGLKEGDQIIKTMSGGVQKVKTKSGDIVYVNLANGYRGGVPPLPFDEGGMTQNTNEYIYAKQILRRAVMKGDLTEEEANSPLAFEIAKEEAEDFADAEEMGSSDFGYMYRNFLETYKEVKENTDSFSKGGTTRERKYVNYRQKHEVRYSKNKPHRRGYGYEDGGFMADVYAEGGQTIDAFQMRMVKGVDSKPSEVLTTEQEVKFAKGGGVGKKQKSFRERRNEYLERLGQKEADVWDKIGAESGSEIRNDEKMLRAYAEGVEEMLQKEGVGKGSFDQEDYDFYTGENWHLFNEFLVWNGYYEPEMTKTEKAWREDRFKDPKYKNYVANPKVITLKRAKDEDKIDLGYGFEIIVEKHSYTNGKSTYGAILHYANKLFKFFVVMPNTSKKEAINNVYDYIKTLKVSDKISENSPKKGEYSVYFNDRGGEHRKTFDTKFDAQEFINMVNYLTKNSKPKSNKYIVKADIKEVKVKTDAGYEYTFKGTDVLNGVNILEKGSLLKNNATYVAKRNIIHVELKNGEKVKPANGYWIKKDAKGELFKPESKEEKMTYEEFLKKRPKSVTGQVYSTNFGGGEGKVVKRTFYYGRSKYIDRVGWFNRDKGKSITDEVAYKLYLEEPSSTNDKKSFSGGGSTKRGGAMQLAKQIRKDGESWQSALKRANEEIRNK